MKKIGEFKCKGGKATRWAHNGDVFELNIKGWFKFSGNAWVAVECPIPNLSENPQSN